MRYYLLGLIALLLLNGCASSGYHPHYIISHEECVIPDEENDSL